MFPGLNPKKMQELMKQMGISQENIGSSQVIINQIDGKKIIIENPSVTKMKIQGQETFQITGDVKEEDFISEGDIKTVMEKTGVSKEKAKKALEKNNGDLAETILELSD
ncbi:nascent polypeptide-associated complex protein [Candidatus Pacearchaeota archaeon]|nr:nascent polypeptide-associated complex protein [Candidatus Pacearchaeota archaeon]